MHLDDETIQRLLHGELDPPSEAASRAHVATCRECQARVDEAEREEEAVLELLGRLDREHTPPSVDAQSLAARARGRSWGWQRRAAAILLAVGAAGAAYAAPGSPLPEWIDRVAGWVGQRGEAGEAPSTATDTGGTAGGSAGISVEPTGPFTIVFEAEQREGALSVVVTDTPDIVVRSLGGSAAFTTDAARLTIRNQASTADFEIELPREAPRVEIFVGGRSVLLKEGSRVVTRATTDAGGRYLVPLARSRS